MSTRVWRSLTGRLCLLVVLLGIPGGATVASAQPPAPGLTTPVNDFGDVIDPKTEQQIEALILQLQKATGDVMVVATVKTYQPWPDLTSYAVTMFENGGKGIGQKGRDNGVLIVLAVDDRQVRVEVGYDLEGFLTDGFSGEVSRRVMVPLFRSGDYGEGLLAGATRIAQRIAEGRGVDLGIAPVESRQDTEVDMPIGVWIVLLIIFLNMIGVGRSGRRRGRRWASGAGAFGAGLPRGGGGWGSSGGFGGGFGGFGGGRSGGGGGGASW